jgi:hypothetical protein
MSRTAQRARMDGYAAKAIHDRAWSQGNEPRRECEPTYSLDRQIAQARADMGEARWQQLQAEWECGT